MTLEKDVIDDVVDLNMLEPTSQIECPYCGKGKMYLYGATGMQSSGCYICKRIVLWDFDHQKAYKAKVRKFAS